VNTILLATIHSTSWMTGKPLSVCYSSSFLLTILVTSTVSIFLGRMKKLEKKFLKKNRTTESGFLIWMNFCTPKMNNVLWFVFFFILDNDICSWAVLDYRYFMCNGQVFDLCIFYLTRLKALDFIYFLYQKWIQQIVWIVGWLFFTDSQSVEWFLICTGTTCDDNFDKLCAWDYWIFE
jgi:hypothetical protein